MEQRIFACILAGGSGQRLGNEKPKQLMTLGDRPMILWSLETFLAIDDIEHVIVTCPEKYLKETRDIVDNNERISIIAGGKTRQGSVYNALSHLCCNDDDTVLIHDAARPFVRPETIIQCIKGVAQSGAVSVYVPAIDTLAEIVDNCVITIPDRNNYYYTQTPQGFRFSLIKDAHERALSVGITNASDDVILAIDAGYTVQKIDGKYTNMKITTPVDFIIAQYFIEENFKK